MKREIDIDPRYLDFFRDPVEAERIVRAATSFREFLNHWKFIDTTSGTERTLGHVLWPAQEEFVRVAETHMWVYYLKARQLGETTMEEAFDGWVMRFRDPLARVHLIDYRDEEVKEKLEAVKYGIFRLPEEWQLPILKENDHELRIGTSASKRRMVRAYPTSRNPGRGQACTHVHVDELAAMELKQRAVWKAVQPSAHGSLHILTTGVGPQDESASMWRRVMDGRISDHKGHKMHACFIGALERPDRDEKWLREQRAGMTEEDFRREYALTWQDALFGGGEFVFKSAEVDRAAEDAYGLQPPEPGCKYVKGWDIGQVDAAVGTVLKLSPYGCMDIVAWRRLVGVSYPEMQREIEAMHKAYPGPTAIEDNAMGKAVRENLKLPEDQVHGWTTSKPSKAKIIEGLRIAMQRWAVKWDPDQVPKLDEEVRGYQIPDENVQQDAVMSLAIAIEFAPLAYLVGRIGTISHV